MTGSTTRHCLWALLVAVVAPSSASAQNYDWAYKMFEDTSHDFGTVARGAEISFRFRFTNLYKETLHISNVRTACTCFVATPPAKTTIGSLESGYIEVKFDTVKFKHQRTSKLIVTFDAPYYAQVTLPLKGYIRSDVVLTPGAAEFGSVDVGQGATKVIDVNYAGRADWTLKEVRTDNKFIETSVREMSRSGGRVNYQIEVQIKPGVPVGTIREQLMLVTDDANPYVPMQLTATVEADITVATPAVSLGAVQAGQEKPFSVVIRGKKPFEIAKVECESEAGLFKIRLPKEARLVHVLPMTFSAPNDAGSVTEVFTVTISGRDEPVKFTATANVASALGKSF